MLYSHRHRNISRKIIKDIMRTSMNERTHFFIKIYLSHFILERVMFVVCERWVETRTDCYFELSSSDHSSTSFSSWRGCSTVGHGGPQVLWLELVLTLASCLQLTWTICAPGYIIVWLPLASAVLPLNYPGASLDWRLVRGSIYNTCTQNYFTYIKFFETDPRNISWCHLIRQP